jgi:hypothetical protein
LLQQGRFADARVATQQNHSTGHQPAAKNPVELAEPGAMPCLNVVRKLGKRSC